MIKGNKVYCDRCGDRIYKNGYLLDILLCNRCHREVYMVNVNDLVKGESKNGGNERQSMDT